MLLVQCTDVVATNKMYRVVLTVAAVCLPLILALTPIEADRRPTIKRDFHDDARYLLQKVSEPISYKLHFDISNVDFYFYHGTVEILMRYTGEQNHFYLHSKGLVIDESSVTVTRPDGTNLPVANLIYMDQFEQVYFGFAERLQTGGTYIVRMNFMNNIGTELEGLYRSSYTVGNVTRVPSGDYTETVFDTTPLMSTYLVAFVVSDFKTLSEDSRLRVFSVEGKVAHTEYALEFLGKSLRSLETFFGHQYQLPKVDLIAIPDFAMGAMENWGLITFRETYLIYEEGVTTARTKQNIADLITHELTHQWFGNEVTPEWWTYLWLSEGFARYFEYYITSQLEPTWHLWEQFIVNNVHSALSQDCNSDNRPMSYYATEPSILNDLFDYVVYAKSASVIRMIQNVIGFDTFKIALNDYLRSRSYLTTKPQYLYESIEKFRTVELPASVEAIFESWANAPGYPVVTVTVDTSSRTLTASQKRFFMPDEDEDPPKNELFYVPLNYASNVPVSNDFDNTAPTFWLTPTTPEVTVPIESDIEWLVVNKQQTGYYRVNYDQQSWNRLIGILNSDHFDTDLPVINRAQMVDDVANLARAGKVGYDIALSLMQYLERETEYIPWSTAYNALLHLDSMYSSTIEYGRFEDFLRTITGCMYENVRLTGLTDHISRLHRGNTVYLACYSGVQKCLDDAGVMVKYTLDNPSSAIPEEVQAAVFCALHKHPLPMHDYETLNLFERYILVPYHEGQPGMINRYLTSLGCSRNETLIEYFLALTANDYPGFPITAQQKTQLYIGLANGSPLTRMTALQYMQEHFSTVSYLLPSIAPIFTEFGNRINSQAEYEVLEQIVSKYGDTLASDVKDAAEMAHTQAEENIRWVTKYAGAITSWLKEQNYEGTTQKPSGGDDGGGAHVHSIGIFVAVGCALMAIGASALPY
uniref:Aminopeptidase n=1 Tax=Anopheles atroparvus TaxID=41427 RepID=A0A182J7J6_ANOAO